MISAVQEIDHDELDFFQNFMSELTEAGLISSGPTQMKFSMQVSEIQMELSPFPLFGM